MLAATAHGLNREAGAPAIPALYFLTDPARTPDPVKVARTLPPGTCVIYRHFGAPERSRVARALKRVCDARGLTLLIAADPLLARRIGADGVHWPERQVRRMRIEGRLVTAAAHSARGVKRAAKADAILLSPLFATASASARPPLGVARAARLAQKARTYVIALGGINAANARTLKGRGFAGLACVEALTRA